MERSIAIGPVQVSLVRDAMGSMDGDHVFYPSNREEWSRALKPGLDGALPLEVNSVLLAEGEELTLVDTGFGEEERPERRETLLGNLAALGVQPKQITRVILTHSHGDHVMGNTLRRERHWLPTFPRAEYVIQEAEIAVLRSTNDPLWVTRFQALEDHNQLRLLNGAERLSPAIAVWPTPGHTIGHQAVLVSAISEAGDSQALILGDLVIFMAQFEYLDWGPDWAWDRAIDQETRMDVAAWACERQALLIAPHDPRVSLARLEAAKRGYRVCPLPWAGRLEEDIRGM